MIVYAKVDSELHIDVTDVGHPLLTEVAQRFTVLNPELDKRLRLGLDTSHVQPTVRLFRYSFVDDEGGRRKFMSVPRGSILSTLRLFRARGYQIDIESNARKFDTDAITIPDLAVTLRDYQQEAVNALMGRVQGFISLPCGSGKTVLGSAAIVVANQPSLVLVHTEDICEQWEQTFKSLHFLQPRVVGAGSNPYKWNPLSEGEVAVCMVQTLHANPNKRKALLGSAGAVLMDECHHAPAQTFRTLFEDIPARYRWGLTATPERSDGWTSLLPMFVGPKLYHKSMDSLIEGGYLMRPKIYALSSGVSPPPMNNGRYGTKKTATKAVTWVCENKERLDLLVEVIRRGADAGRTTLVLVPRVKLAKKVAETLRSVGYNAKAITGGVSKPQRARVLDDMRAGRLSILVATQLADEGLDVPNIDLLVNASGGRTSGRAIQRIGRAMRVSDGKPTPIVVELIDGGGMFRSQWKARALAYSKQLNCTASPVLKRKPFFSVLERELEACAFTF